MAPFLPKRLNEKLCSCGSEYNLKDSVHMNTGKAMEVSVGRSVKGQGRVQFCYT